MKDPNLPRKMTRTQCEPQIERALLMNGAEILSCITLPHSKLGSQFSEQAA